MNNDNSRSWILKYIDLIDKGEIIVGEELYLQLEKLKHPVLQKGGYLHLICHLLSPFHSVPKQ